ncbi:division/cell wall cluster transcriptional repressor MraZ [Fulvivirgaceae bacterium BMA12]|uniref:Transcriptional regulator MraZ n=1 Tax=Agaribacillus aureus TaxID=3051825 RepID=A0ABT8L1M0_9BACT|nr:division/cell wall cluster transcriptional repressor MraZ [Fulvivirgaceae bacterium BMA12]
MAARFKGEYVCKLDSKGRLMFPARLKGSLPEANTMNLILKKGFEPCLTIYPQAEWDAMMDRFEDLDEFSPKARKFERSFFRGAEEVEMDRNFRFLIPKKLIDELGFKKEVRVLGVNNRVEIWDADTLDQYVAQEEEFSELASDMMKIDKNGQKT